MNRTDQRSSEAFAPLAISAPLGGRLSLWSVAAPAPATPLAPSAWTERGHCGGDAPGRDIYTVSVSLREHTL